MAKSLYAPKLRYCEERRDEVIQFFQHRLDCDAEIASRVTQNAVEVE